MSESHLSSEKELPVLPEIDAKLDKARTEGTLVDKAESEEKAKPIRPEVERVLTMEFDEETNQPIETEEAEPTEELPQADPGSLEALAQEHESLKPPEERHRAYQVRLDTTAQQIAREESMIEARLYEIQSMEARGQYTSAEAQQLIHDLANYASRVAAVKQQNQADYQQYWRQQQAEVNQLLAKEIPTWVNESTKNQEAMIIRDWWHHHGGNWEGLQEYIGSDPRNLIKLRNQVMQDYRARVAQRRKQMNKVSRKKDSMLEWGNQNKPKPKAKAKTQGPLDNEFYQKRQRFMQQGLSKQQAARKALQMPKE